MITDEKIATVRKALKSGIPQGELYNELVNEGYSEDDINKVFVPHEYNMSGWYITFAILFTAAGIFFFNLLLAVFAAILYSLYYNEKQKTGRKRSQ